MYKVKNVNKKRIAFVEMFPGVQNSVLTILLDTKQRKIAKDYDYDWSIEGSVFNFAGVTALTNDYIMYTIFAKDFPKWCKVFGTSPNQYNRFDCHGEHLKPSENGNFLAPVTLPNVGGDFFASGIKHGFNYDGLLAARAEIMCAYKAHQNQQVPNHEDDDKVIEFKGIGCSVYNKHTRDTKQSALGLLDFYILEHELSQAMTDPNILTIELTPDDRQTLVCRSGFTAYGRGYFKLPDDVATDCGWIFVGEDYACCTKQDALAVQRVLDYAFDKYEVHTWSDDDLTPLADGQYLLLRMDDPRIKEQAVKRRFIDFLKLIGGSVSYEDVYDMCMALDSELPEKLLVLAGR